jgi:Tfp pilus assembly protein PilV
MYQQSQGQGLYKPRILQAQSQYAHHQQSQNQSQAVAQPTPASPRRPSPASKKAKPAKEDDSATEGSDTEDEKDDAMQVDRNGTKHAQDQNSLISWDNPIHDYEELIKQPGLISKTNQHSEWRSS